LGVAKPLQVCRSATNRVRVRNNLTVHETRVQDSISGRNMPTTLSTAFDGLALSIAALGVDCLLSLVVAFDRMLTVSVVDQVSIC
jgi:hypothetical protein